MKNRILFVDDNLGNLTSTTELLELWGYEVTACQNAESALKILESGKRFMVALLDYHLGNELTGASLGAQIRTIDPFSVIVIYSCDVTTNPVLEALRAGAINFIDKNEDTDLLKSTLENACALFQANGGVISEVLDTTENTKLIATIGLIGESQELAGVVRQIRRFRELDENLLILGETGVGKECVAKALHRGDISKFFPVNCAGFGSSDTSLIESTLFGHERGAFTGAADRKVGIFEAARGGTVFLDEIHHLPPGVQAILLRVLRERTIRRVGGKETIAIHCRVIAAAKPKIQTWANENKFLPDLFTRLNELSISIPALRYRKQDIKPLTDHFLSVYNRKYKTNRKFTQGVYEAFMSFAWIGGNVGELQNMVRQLVLTPGGTKISTSNLPQELQEATDRPFEELTLDAFEERQHLEKMKFLSEVARTSTSMRHAARRLGRTHTTLAHQFRQLGVKVPEKASS